jgi:hypothetical protein
LDAVSSQYGEKTAGNNIKFSSKESIVLPDSHRIHQLGYSELFNLVSVSDTAWGWTMPVRSLDLFLGRYMKLFSLTCPKV